MNKFSKWFCRVGTVMFFLFACNEMLASRTAAIDVFTGFCLCCGMFGSVDYDDCDDD